MKYSETIKLIEEKVKEGKAKQEIFTEVRNEIKIPHEKLADLLKKTPTLAQRKKYKLSNTLLIIFLLISIFIELLNAWFVVNRGIKFIDSIQVFLFPIAYLFFVVKVINFRANTYKHIVVFAVLDILIFLLNLSSINFSDSFSIALMLNYSLLLISIYLGIILDKRLNSTYTRKFEKYTTKDGQEKTRILYIMDEE